MIDLAVLYAILRGVAARKGIVSYEELSRLYHEAAGEWHGPHGTWEEPLAQVNGHARAAGLPPISALVTDKPDEKSGFGPPGGGFWDSPGVPPRPRKGDDRLLVWMGFVNLAHRASWPQTLPGLG
jgi:hypothetical protein